jgi:hypothetical protein
MTPPSKEGGDGECEVQVQVQVQRQVQGQKQGQGQGQGQKQKPMRGFFPFGCAQVQNDGVGGDGLGCGLDI